MSFRPPPQPTDERARHTEDLIRRQETDMARWRKVISDANIQPQ